MWKPSSARLCLATLLSCVMGACGSQGTSDGDGTDACMPTTCSALHFNCGLVRDGCGSTLNCGSCTSPESCGGGGVANVCGQGAGLVVAVTPSRNSGVVPLTVFFDTTETPTFSDGSYIDATVMWNFDVDDTDPNGHYERASGFVAAHVFDQPGTYLVRAQVCDAQGRAGYADVFIEAQEFTGTTYYVAADGDDEHTGTSMDDPVQTIQHALIDVAQPNTRVLFRRGDTFETTYLGVSGRTGPVIIGSYLDPNSPSDQAPVIFNTSVDEDWGTLFFDNDDWRIMDLHVRSGGLTCGEAGPRYPGGARIGGTNSLLYRLEQDQLCGLIGSNGTHNAVVECNHHHSGSGGWSSTMDGPNTGNALIGNWVHDCSENDDMEHSFRLQGGSKYFIAFNVIDHAAVNYDTLTIRGDSEAIVIYRNVINGLLSIEPQNRSSAEEYQHHCVVDSNLFVGRSEPGYVRIQAILIDSKDIVIRNNTFYNYSYQVGIDDDTVVGPSARIKLLNNTAIGVEADDDFVFVSAASVCTGIVIENNLMVDASGNDGNRARFLAVVDGDVFQGESDHNAFYGTGWSSSPALFPEGQTLTAWQTSTGQDLHSFTDDPGLLSIDPLARVDGSFARPTPTGPVVNAGALIPGLASDFYGTLRDETPDIGAVQYSDQAPPIPW